MRMMKSNIRSSLVVLTGYFLLTILMTWPTAQYLTTGIPGDGFDGWQNYWNLWWVKQSLLNNGTSPFFTHYLYAPTGVSLLFHTLNIFNGFWTLPLQLNFGLAVAYNSVVFLSFTLAGYGAYLLSLYTLNKLNLSSRCAVRPAAFVGGLIFTMSPFHFAHLLGHMQVFSMIWPPFYVLWLLRTLEPWQIEPSADNRFWRNTSISALFLILAALVDWYHMLYLLIFTGLVLLWTLVYRVSAHGLSPKIMRYPLSQTLAIGAGFGLIMWPLLLPMMRHAGSRPDLQTGLSQNVTLSADLLAFVTPSEMHPLWGAWAAGIANNFSTTTSERLIFAGFIPLALGIFIAIRWQRKLAVKFWSLIALVFLVLALGPYLHIGGKIISIGGWQIPMPYLLLYHTVPFIGLTRSLSRYDLMVMLALGILAAIFIAQSSIFKRKGWGALIIGTLVCFEFLAIPYPISKIDTPAFFYQLGRDTADYTIAELPMNWDRPTPLLHQTTHGKRLLTAYTSRDNPLELAWRTPVFQQWRYLGADIIDQPLSEIAPTIFYDVNLRYITLDYWQMPPGPERDATEKWVAAAIPGAEPVYQDDRLTVYQTPAKESTQPYLSLGDGWSDRLIGADGQISRSFTPGSGPPPELFVHPPEYGQLQFEITAVGAAPQTVTVLADGRPLRQFQVTTGLGTTVILLSWTLNAPLKLTFESDTPGAAITVTRLGLEIAPECTDPGAAF
jgi:hypothetical protein